MYRAKVYVTLKESVKDPQGQAVTDSLRSLGYDGVQDVRIGKIMDVRLRADSERAAAEQLEAMCQQLLANPVIETYRVQIMEVEQ